MKRNAKRPSFLHGVLVAVVLAVAAGVIASVLAPLIGLGFAVRLLVPALALAYVLYLLGRSNVRSGRVTALAAWGAVALAGWWFAPPLPAYLALHTGAIWLVRSFFFYSGVLPPVLDLALSAAAFVLTAWAATHTSSLALATWCFFLVQALFAVIPSAFSPGSHGRLRGRFRAHGTSSAPERSDGFERARRQAETALQQLFTR